MSDIPPSLNLAQLAAILDESSDFRVLRRFAPPSSYGDPSGRIVAKGLVLDTETTGMSPETEHVIEIAIVAFEYDPDSGEIFRILDSYCAFEDPGVLIPPEATAINGITNEMVRGHSFDDARIREMVDDATLVIAHNAGFDRPFMEKRFPLFMELPWGCSIKQIDWAGEGLGSSKLEYLAWRSGFFYEAHRAEVDCRVLLDILHRPTPSVSATSLL